VIYCTRDLHRIPDNNIANEALLTQHD